MNGAKTINQIVAVGRKRTALGRVEEWKGGRVEGWKGGRVEGRKGAFFQLSILPLFLTSALACGIFALG